MVVMLIAFTATAQKTNSHAETRINNIKKENPVEAKETAPPWIKQKTAIMDESFETWPLTDWGFFSYGDEATWQQTNAQAHSGTYCVYHDDDNVTTNCNDWLVSPQITITEPNTLLSFWQYQNFGSYYELHEVVILDGPDPSTANTLELLLTGAGTEDTWTEHIYYLSAYEGQDIYIGFYYEGDYADEWYIDDFMIYTVEDNDLGINSLTPSGIITSTDPITPTVTIQNYGGIAQSTFDITLVSDPAGYSETVSNPGTIEPGAILTIDFPNWSPTDGSYTLTATVVLADDANSENDIATSEVEVRINDLGVNTVTPSGVVSTGSTITPTVTIENYGGVAQSTYHITLVSDPAGYSETVSNPGTIEPGTTLTIDFPDWSPADGTYTLTATVVFANDGFSGNDIATSEIEVRGVGFGDVIHSFNTEMAGCAGIETDGNHIYTVYWNPGTAGRNFDKYTMDGTFVEEFEITGVSAVRDLAYNPATGYFYGAAANTTLWEMDLENKTLVSTITAPVECRAIAFDEGSNTLWANNWSTDLTEFDLTGTATGNSFPITTSIYGAAYDKWSDPENPTLWLFNNGENPETIVEYTMDGTATGRQIDITTVPGYASGGIGGGLASFEADGVAYLLANIQQDPNLIVKFYLVSTAETYSVTLTINDGTDPLEGATVTFDGDNYTTDVDGIVTIADVADGTHAYSVAMDGYDTATGDIVVDGADVEQTITLTPAVATYTVTLTVVDADGAIEGATVTFDGDNYTTDVDGIVTIADVASGTYAFSIAMDGYDTEAGDIVVADADVEQTITLTITGIDNGLLSNLKVYPNPFSSHITITNAEKVNRVVITNLIGQIVKDVTLNGTETISTSKLANGIYLVTFEGINGERAVRKMVKQ